MKFIFVVVMPTQVDLRSRGCCASIKKLLVRVGLLKYHLHSACDQIVALLFQYRS